VTILNRDNLLAGDLAAEVLERRRRALNLVDCALAAVDAGVAVADVLARVGPIGRCTIFAFGKAAVPMARAALAAVDVGGGFVLGLGPDPGDLAPLRYRRAGHPLPLAGATEQGAEVLALARSLGPSDVALCLVSGGGSAMLELPRPGTTIEQIVEETRRLLRGGADIAELNAARIARSQLKGGGLGRAMAPARVINLVLSDVGGHGPEVVASGPTIVPGATTVVVADNHTARDAIAARGLDPVAEALAGAASAAGVGFYDGGGGPARVAGGETTVEVTGSGRGGRNHEFVLGPAAAGWRGGLLLSFGTDGTDGTSDAAGALIDGAVLARARTLGLDPRDHLRRNDSDAFFRRAGGRIVTGPTGTNVADVALFLP